MRKSTCFTVGLLGIFLGATAFGQQVAVGKVGTAAGTVSLTSAGGAAKKIAVGALVHEGDIVTTSAGSTARVDFADGSLMKIGENSKCEIRKKGTKTADETKLHLFSGKMRIKVKADRVARASFEVSTPTAVAGVRGTDFLVSVLQPGKPTTVNFAGVVGGSAIAGPAGPPATAGHAGSPGTAGPPVVTQIAVFKGIITAKSSVMRATVKGALNVIAGRIARVVEGRPPSPIRRLNRIEIRQMKASLPLKVKPTDEVSISAGPVEPSVTPTEEGSAGTTASTEEAPGTEPVVNVSTLVDSIGGEVVAVEVQNTITEDIQEVAVELLPEPPAVPSTP